MSVFLCAFGLAGLFLGWNVPNHYPLWTTFHGELAAAVGICCLFAAAWYRSSTMAAASGLPAATATQVKLLPASVGWLLASSLPLAQFGLGQLAYHGDAVIGALYGLGVVFSLQTGLIWANQSGRAPVLKILHLTVVASAIVAGGLAMAQWLRVPAWSWWVMELIADRPFGNLAQPNLFGLLMVMGLVSGTMLFETQSITRRWTLHLLLAFLGFGLLLSGSRACQLALLVIAGLWFLSRRKVPSRLRIADVLGALAAGSIVYMLLGRIEDMLLLKGAGMRSPVEVGPRELIWRHYAAAILEHPWWGYGFNQGIAALREVAGQVAPSRNATFAHNVVLDLFAWFGIPIGLLLILALTVWMLGWLRRSTSPQASAQQHGVFALWLALLVHSLLEFPYAHTFFLLPVALFAGVIGADEDAASAHPPRRFGPDRFTIMLAMVATALLVVTTNDYLDFESDFRENRFDKANFIGGQSRPPTPDLLLLNHLDELGKVANFKTRRGMPKDELDRLGAVAGRFHLLVIQFAYAKALALNVGMPEARAEMRRIRAVYHPSMYARIEADWIAWVKEHPELGAP